MTQLTLDRLGLEFGTDKASNGHDYLRFYERFFEKFRNNEIRILEIGVFEGNSLKVWEAYFENALIVGADINPSSTRFARPRVCIEIMDQSNLEDLVALAVKYGPFDIVIEDGSHLWEHQITTLRTLFPFVRNGGIYIVEDLQTNFVKMAANYKGVASFSCVEYLKRLIDFRVADDQLTIETEEDAFLRTYGRAVGFIAFYRRACLIEKNYPVNSRRQIVGSPLVPLPDTKFVPLVLTAHIGNEGDRLGEQGWIRSAGAVYSHSIQGFRFDVQQHTELLLRQTSDFLYRARLHDGTWTGWVSFGEFIGTRGKGNCLTGFAVKLGPRSVDTLKLEVIGEFRGEPGVISVGNGEDCVTSSGNGNLSGMQVILRQEEEPRKTNRQEKES